MQRFFIPGKQKKKLSQAITKAHYLNASLESYGPLSYFIPVSGWFKINTEVVCFGARNNSYGKFRIHKAGNISAFKLAHRSGSVSCLPGADKGTNWGCSHPLYIGQICTHITDASNVRIVNVSDSGHGCYQLPGFAHNSSEIELSLSSPVGVRAGQEFRIWYAEDLKNLNDDDNAFNKSCVIVYGFY